MITIIDIVARISNKWVDIIDPASCIYIQVDIEDSFFPKGQEIPEVLKGEKVIVLVNTSEAGEGTIPREGSERPEGVQVLPGVIVSKKLAESEGLKTVKWEAPPKMEICYNVSMTY